MYWDEISCQICAVSFNAARLRTKLEPQESGWGYVEGLHYAHDVSISLSILYPEVSGCEFDRTAGPHGLHFPGRGCKYIGGMNEWKIGVDEMKGMRHPRYILRKPMDWDGEEDEQEEYERGSGYFVSSQSRDQPLSHDPPDPGDLAIVRFGVDAFTPSNFDGSAGSDEGPFGVPVHDACWKIFERVSKLRLGNVDLQGIMALWQRQACKTCGFQELPQDPNIKKCKGPWWTHYPGTEYLGVNPIDILALIVQLHSSNLDGLPGYHVVDSSPSPEHQTDIFRLLPFELRMMILSRPSSKEISSLRQASRSFRYISKHRFLQLIHEEQP
ncbi:hypothetical protein BKA64DRAFT_23111 [Cadophora sp. MPI-SDFR-AT-0126]|nr:hypothetical protein BKA64DRAFT_23111 [Leotiomycetes sp. MPI-SDFR-AT-0126]